MPGPKILFASAGDPEDAGTHSGLPAQVLAALRHRVPGARGARVSLPPPLDPLVRRGLALGQLRLPDLRDPAFAWRDAQLRVGHTPEMAWLRAAALRGRLHRRPVAAVVQHGTEFDLGLDVPLVTYEDQTLAQALSSYPYPELLRASPRTLRRWHERSRRLYLRARGCCTTSHRAAESIVEDYGVSESKVHVVGVGRNLHPGVPSRDWSVPRFLFVAADWERKGGPELLSVFRELRRERPDAELHVVGRHPAVAQPGVVPHGFFPLGDDKARARLSALFRECTCLVLPSRHEPSATVLAEAAAAGLPSIGPASGGSATIMGDGGVLVPAGESTALLAALRDLADARRAEALGARAAARAELFTWLAVADRLLRALALDGAPGKPAEFL